MDGEGIVDGIETLIRLLAGLFLGKGLHFSRAGINLKGVPLYLLYLHTPMAVCEVTIPPSGKATPCRQQCHSIR